tara:strand:+ start:7101 stop:7289 length:189 start_codon:yes stop_codon:yes gene_type:complete
MKNLISAFFFVLGLGAFSAQAQQLPLNQPVPDVTAYDADGNAFSFRDNLKGETSVVVFGCLT